jgi:assimilatory nitrate reductase catalytic subunit
VNRAEAALERAAPAPPLRTTCPYCGVGCGLIAQRDGDAVSIRGDPAHPANRGALCSKGAALGETLSLEGRLLTPQLRGRTVDWPTALDAVAEGLARIIAAHGPDAVALYVSGQLLTEDYYVANKLMKGFIGSANIDTNSRLCMSSAVAAHTRAFGEDLVPVSYADLELAELVVLVGSNTAWCHPVIFQRILQARERRPSMRLVVIDPRRTPTCEAADLHLPLRSGSDVALFNGLLCRLAQRGLADRAFLESHTQGAAQALAAAEPDGADAAAVARVCGLDPAALERFYDWFAATERVVTAFSQGVNQSSAGTDKANSIINVHLLTGRIGREGMGPMSLTGQPNAMGGREVGGLATALAAHLDFADPTHRQLLQRFWRAPRMAQRPGLKAVDLFEAVHRGEVKAVWIMATNPVVSLPDADRVREALRGCELVVVSDCIADTDTTRLAHVLLPAAAWGEKDGTVTNSDRCISRQRAFLPLPGAARPDWWIVSEVARRLGFEAAFGYASAAEIFDEHARLSAVDNDGARAFDLGRLAALGAAGYARLEPTQWPVQRLFADRRFYHRDRRARLVATPLRLPRFACDAQYPLVLNTGRIRDQWHTMTRTGRAPRLALHLPEPFVDMHPADALHSGLRADSLVRVVTRWGALVARLRCSGEIARGSVFVPIHWSDTSASDARIGALVSAATDPVSGEPEFKHTPARVEPFEASWYGFVLARAPPALESVSWWCASAGGTHGRYEIADRAVPADWPARARALLRAGADADWIDYADGTTGTYRAAWLREGRLEGCLFAAARAQLPERGWLAALFERAALSAADRRHLLSGRAPGQAADPGAIVCVCHCVGRLAIERAIAAGARDAPALGRALKAGSNCGSCLPELQRLIGAADRA